MFHARTLTLSCLLALAGSGCQSDQAMLHLQGVFWQPTAQKLQPYGNWNVLGIDTLIVQWSMVGELGLLNGCGEQSWRGEQPDWATIGRQPWGKNVVLGLAGDYDEARARSEIPLLVARAHCIIEHQPDLHIMGWYFPVEADPSWSEVTQLKEQLHSLPRPLWISIYDNSNIGGEALADWLQAWLPNDVGVFFQDGVGLHTRDPQIAKQYADALTARLGAERVRLIAETFRPSSTGTGFRAATADELTHQLTHYAGLHVYLFEGPHYLNDLAVNALHQRLNKKNLLPHPATTPAR